MTDLFAKEVVKLHQVPRSIVRDRDPTFISRLWQEFFKLKGTTLRMSTAYHLEINGQTKLMCGRKPPTLLRYLPSEILVEAMANDLKDCDEAIKQLTYHLQSS
ncbi:hypothetical protein CR513_30280, partial [Mucuna pruriens]